MSAAARDAAGFTCPQAARAVPVVASVGGAAALLLLAAPRPPLSPVPLVSWLADASPDAALVNLATLAAWLCLGWLTAGATVTALAAVPGLSGRIASRLATALIPIGLRRMMEAALGITVVTAPAIGLGPLTPAWADARPPAPTWSAPSLDRPAGQVALPAKPHAHSPAYVVRPGDCLWSIARGHLSGNASARDIAAAWPQWYAINKTAIGADPNVIHPGQRLKVPDARGGGSR